MVAVSGNRDLSNLAGVRVRLRDPFGHSRFNDGSANRTRERVRTYGFTGVLVRIHAVHEERFGLIALFLHPVAPANSNTLLPSSALVRSDPPLLSKNDPVDRSEAER